MKAYFGPHALDVRADLWIELESETDELRLQPATSIEFVDGPGGQPPHIEGVTLRCVQPGRYLFRVASAEGTQDLRVCCFEPDAAEWIASQVRTAGHGGESMGGASTSKVRGVVRSLSQHAPAFTGTRESLMAGSGISLHNHGC